MQGRRGRSSRFLFDFDDVWQGRRNCGHGENAGVAEIRTRTEIHLALIDFEADAKGIHSGAGNRKIGQYCGNESSRTYGNDILTGR